jgi:uroporphyrinogen decarboxylase
MNNETPRERFIKALERKPLIGKVPHFELAFYLSMEAIGKVHPLQRSYEQWNQMEEKERQLHRLEIADIYIQIAEKYEHSAILVQPQPGTFEECARLIEIIREKSGDTYCLLKHGDVTYGIPDGDQMAAFCYRMADEPQKMKDEMEGYIDFQLEKAAKQKSYGGLDGFAMCSDYCLNTGPFLSPRQFRQFVTPFLKRLIAGYRELGFYTIKHTDGNIMPILDQLIETNPHALHSLDPQAGVDIAEVKQKYGDQVCLIGNVNCGLLDTGSDEEVIESTRYALKNGMPGGGYIFSTSNCIYTGMPLKRYELMVDVWKKEGVYGLA